MPCVCVEVECVWEWKVCGGRRRMSPWSTQPRTLTYQGSSIKYQPSTINYQISIIHRQLSTFNHRQRCGWEPEGELMALVDFAELLEKVCVERVPACTPTHFKDISRVVYRSMVCLIGR